MRCAARLIGIDVLRLEIDVALWLRAGHTPRPVSAEYPLGASPVARIHATPLGQDLRGSRPELRTSGLLGVTFKVRWPTPIKVFLIFICRWDVGIGWPGGIWGLCTGPPHGE